MNGDHPVFARVEYLVITELTIATLFALVFVMRHQLSCCRFFALPAASLVASWKTIEPSSSSVASYQSPSAVPVKFHNYNDNVTRVAGRLWVPICLALCLDCYLEILVSSILMSMVVKGPSLLYDVYWLDLMMVIVNRWQVLYNGYLNRIEIPEHSSGSEIAQYWSNNNRITHNE